jgi:hypothetical protein
MAQEKQTLGLAIDQVVKALESLDENTRKTALFAVCAHLQIDVDVRREAAAKGAPQVAATKESIPALHHSAHPASSPGPKKFGDIRSLKEEKKPATARQMACLVAYYLKEEAPEGERKETVSTADLEKYFKQAGFKLPGTIRQVLPDAKSGGYFDSAARGAYKLNAVGYNLVVHNLPSDTAGTK